MDTPSPYDSRQFFCLARKLLGRAFLVALFRVSEREVYRWGADTNHADQWRENPLEKLATLCRQLDLRGFEAEAAAPVHILAEALGLRVVDRSPLPGDAAPREVWGQAREVADRFFATLHRGDASPSEVSELLSRAVRGLEAAASCYAPRSTPAELYFAASGTDHVSPFAGKGTRPWWKFWGRA